MIIKFEKIGLNEEGNTVNIIGDLGINIKMSILQLAKVWETDKSVMSKLENNFGSNELENQCKETRDLIKKFPDIKFDEKEIKFDDISFRETKEENIRIYAEDIVGWNNEGITIEMSKKIYDENLDRKEFFMILIPNGIKLEIKKK
jgi:hypothetical protein